MIKQELNLKANFALCQEIVQEVALRLSANGCELAEAALMQSWNYVSGCQCRHPRGSEQLYNVFAGCIKLANQNDHTGRSSEEALAAIVACDRLDEGVLRPFLVNHVNDLMDRDLVNKVIEVIKGIADESLRLDFAAHYGERLHYIGEHAAAEILLAICPAETSELKRLVTYQDCLTIGGYVRALGIARSITGSCDLLEACLSGPYGERVLGPLAFGQAWRTATKADWPAVPEC